MSNYLFTPDILEKVTSDVLNKYIINGDTKLEDVPQIINEITDQLEEKVNYPLVRSNKWDYIDQGGQMQLVKNIYVFSCSWKDRSSQCIWISN